MASVAALLLAGCSDRDPDAPAWPGHREPVDVEGRVRAADVEPWFRDGDAEFVLDTLQHGRVMLLVPARESLCTARGMDIARELAVGDTVRASGSAVGPRRMRLCRSPADLLERVDP